jgi:hypothetical protein
MKIYISGKITGLQLAIVQQRFDLTEKLIKTMGHETINPMNLGYSHDQAWESIMKVHILSLLKCDAVFFMKDWEDSDSAILENTIAEALKIERYYSFEQLLSKLIMP